MNYVPPPPPFFFFNFSFFSCFLILGSIFFPTTLTLHPICNTPLYFKSYFLFWTLRSYFLFCNPQVPFFFLQSSPLAHTYWQWQWCSWMWECEGFIVSYVGFCGSLDHNSSTLPISFFENLTLNPILTGNGNGAIGCENVRVSLLFLWAFVLVWSFVSVGKSSFNDHMILDKDGHEPSTKHRKACS